MQKQQITEEVEQLSFQNTDTDVAVRTSAPISMDTSSIITGAVW
jgi:hypothetical protein